MPRFLTVRELKEIINELEDNVVVLISDHDHGYRTANVEASTALEEEKNRYTEDHGEQYTPEADFGKRVPAVLIS